MSTISEDVLNQLNQYVKYGTKVTLQVKDLEPTDNTRHFSSDMGGEPEKYITGIIYHDEFSPQTFVFLEDGKNAGQDVLYYSLSNIKKAEINKGGRRKGTKKALKKALKKARKGTKKALKKARRNSRRYSRRN
jgi:hypothetical protein